jgi:hypothetical protein
MKTLSKLTKTMGNNCQNRVTKRRGRRRLKKRLMNDMSTEKLRRSKQTIYDPNDKTDTDKSKKITNQRRRYQKRSERQNLPTKTIRPQKMASNQSELVTSQALADKSVTILRTRVYAICGEG